MWILTRLASGLAATSFDAQAAASAHCDGRAVAFTCPQITGTHRVKMQAP